jgi:YebC/PmpR family DNA-binding regulatory protein
MYQKARDASVPLDTIERAIKRGTGELEGVTYEEVNYEGYAPHGVAVYVECLTDNRNRTGPEIRTLFSKLGGSIAEPGAVAWQFERKGVITVPGSVGEDDLMLVAIDAGAEDIRNDGDAWTVVCEATLTAVVRTAIAEAGIAVISSDLTMLPSSLVELDSADVVKPILRLIDALDEHDDVQDVYANFDIPESVLAELDA